MAVPLDRSQATSEPEQSFEGEWWVRWNVDTAERLPHLGEAVARFDAGASPVASAAAAWLRESRLLGEAVVRLWVVDGGLLGFFSLAGCEVRLSQRQRAQAGLEAAARRTQPGVLLTWIAKSVQHGEVDGRRLLLQALGDARASAESVAATVLAVDPYDSVTQQFWLDRGFVATQSRPAGAREDDERRRLVVRIAYSSTRPRARTVAP